MKIVSQSVASLTLRYMDNPLIRKSVIMWLYAQARALREEGEHYEPIYVAKKYMRVKKYNEAQTDSEVHINP